MLAERFYWEDGLRLDSQVLEKSDLAISSKAEYSNFLSYNLEKGIVSFVLDEDSLGSGLILVKELKLYIEGKALVHYDKSYSLSLQVTEWEMGISVPIFLDIFPKLKEVDGNKYICNYLSLSTEKNYGLEHSIQISQFKFNNGSLEPEYYNFPLLTLNHYLFEELFLEIDKLIAELKAFNKFVFSISRPYASMYLSFSIIKLERKLHFAQKNRINIDPLYIFDAIHDIYDLIQVNIDSNEELETIFYDFYRPFDKFRALLNKTFELCKYKKISNFIRFDLQGQKYICETFPEEFFVANKYYFVIKRKGNVINNVKFDNKNALRITSISRNKSIVTLSLSGIKLEEIDTSMVNFSIAINNFDIVYEIKKGTEWDFILADKSAVFSAFKGSEKFDFFIAFM